jgi:predicted RNase H-like HicB family nuclease
MKSDENGSRQLGGYFPKIPLVFSPQSNHDAAKPGSRGIRARGRALLAGGSPYKMGGVERTQPVRIEIDREEDGRIQASVPDLPGVMAYGETREDAVRKVKSVTSQVLAEIETGDPTAPPASQC